MFSQRLKKDFETAVVNEPSVFEQLKFYCMQCISIIFLTMHFMGWSGAAMVLGKLPVPGRPINLDYSRT